MPRIRLGVVLVTAAVVLAALPAGPASAATGRCAKSELLGDFDSDGRSDRALVFVRQPSCDPLGDPASVEGRYRLAVVLATGERIARRLPHCAWDCRVFARMDFDGNGRDELGVQLHAGASTAFFGVYLLHAGRMERALLAGRRDSAGGFYSPWIEFPFFGSVTHRSDVRCRTKADGTRFVVAGSQSFDDPVWTTRLTRFVFDGTGFAIRSIKSSTSVGAEPGPIKGRRCVRPVPGA